MRIALLRTSVVLQRLVESREPQQRLGTINQRHCRCSVEIGGMCTDQQCRFMLADASQCAAAQTDERCRMHAATATNLAERRHELGGQSCVQRAHRVRRLLCVACIVCCGAGVVERRETLLPRLALRCASSRLQRSVQVPRALEVPPTRFVVRIETRALIEMLRCRFVFAERRQRMTAQFERVHFVVVDGENASRVVEHRRVVGSRKRTASTSQTQRYRAVRIRWQTGNSRILNRKDDKERKTSTESRRHHTELQKTKTKQNKLTN